MVGDFLLSRLRRSWSREALLPCCPEPPVRARSDRTLLIWRAHLPKQPVSVPECLHNQVRGSVSPAPKPGTETAQKRNAHRVSNRLLGCVLWKLLPWLTPTPSRLNKTVDAHVKLWMLLIWSPTLTRTQKLEHKTGSQRLAQRSTAYPQWTMFTSLYNVPCPEMGQLRRGATGTNSLGTPISSAAVARLSRNANRSPGDAVGRADTMRGGKERVILRSRPQKQQPHVLGTRFESARLPVHRNLQSGFHVLVSSTLRFPRPIPAAATTKVIPTTRR